MFNPKPKNIFLSQMDPNAIAGYLALALMIADKAYQAINHRRLRSNCCGKEVVASIDVETTTPPPKKPAENAAPPVDESSGALRGASSAEPAGEAATAPRRASAITIRAPAEV